MSRYILGDSYMKAYDWHSPRSMVLPRLALRYIAISVLALVVLLCFRDSFTYRPVDLASFQLPVFRRPIKVAVLETKGCHDEVTASFFSALGQMPECRVEAYLEAQRYGIDDIYHALPGQHRRQIKSKAEFSPSRIDRFNPDIILSVTSEFDSIDGKAKYTLQHLFNETQAVLFAVVHHPDELIRKRYWQRRFQVMKPWIEAKRLRFITLSDHVTDYLIDSVISNWTAAEKISHSAANDLLVNTFPPVFNLPSIIAAEPFAEQNEQRTRFALQGDLVTVRSPNRDYKGTFHRFSQIMGATKEEERKNMELYVLGDGKVPKIPTNVSEYIKFEVGASYPEFYNIIQSATALLPALATEEYLVKKASSTIPASLIAGSPLIADAALLDSYSFLSADDVYMREDGEEEIDAAARIAKLPFAEREAKSRQVRRKNAQLVEKSHALLRSMIFDSIG